MVAMQLLILYHGGRKCLLTGNDIMRKVTCVAGKNKALYIIVYELEVSKIIVSIPIIHVYNL